MSTTHSRTLAFAALAAIGAAILLVMIPLVAEAVSGPAPTAVVDIGPPGGHLDDPARTAAAGQHADSDPAPRPALAAAGDDFGYGAAVRTALITSVLAAAAFLFAMFRARRPAVGVPPEAPPDPPARAASEPLPDDVLAAIPPQVVAATRFGPHGGFVDARGVLVWAALIRPGEPIHPGRALTVLSSSHERDALLVTPAAHRDTRAMTADRAHSE